MLPVPNVVVVDHIQSQLHKRFDETKLLSDQVHLVLLLALLNFRVAL
jgi:hypothetical protein